MRFQTFLVGIILFSSLIAGFYVFLGDLSGSEGYDIDVSNDTAYMNTYNKTQAVSAQMSESYDTITTMEMNPVAQFFTGLTEIAKMLKVIIVTPYTLLAGEDGIISTLTSSTENKGLGFPVWVTGFAIGIIAILVIFAFINALIKWNT